MERIQPKPRKDRLCTFKFFSVDPLVVVTVKKAEHLLEGCAQLNVLEEDPELPFFDEAGFGARRRVLVLGELVSQFNHAVAQYRTAHTACLSKLEKKFIQRNEFVVILVNCLEQMVSLVRLI